MLMRSKFLYIGLPCLALVLRAASGPTANISYLLISLLALLGRAQAIQALSLSWLFSMLNPVFAPDASAAATGRYVVIVAAALSVALRTMHAGAGFYIKKFNLYTACLSLFILVHSLLFSAVVDVSVLKTVSWVLVVMTLLSAWHGLSLLERAKLAAQLEGGLTWLLILSLPFITIPSIGYLRNGTGFQGLLNHPQAFGPTVALAGALIGGRVLGQARPRWRDIALFGMCLVLVILSEARTAGLAMLLGLLLSALCSPSFAGLPRKQMLPGLSSKRFQAVALLGLICISLTGPLLTEKLSAYLFKRSDSTSLVDAADASRGELVTKMFSNIEKTLWFGIGFGIASDPSTMVVEHDSIFGLPVSALVEKGVMPVAVLEEMGIFGATAVLAWLWLMLRRGARRGVSQFAVVTTLLLVNLGESMFFSVGGMGMLLLILLTGAVTGAQVKLKRVPYV